MIENCKISKNSNFEIIFDNMKRDFQLVSSHKVIHHIIIQISVVLNKIRNYNFEIRAFSNYQEHNL
jgi:hypothetical protein